MTANSIELIIHLNAKDNASAMINAVNSKMTGLTQNAKNVKVSIFKAQDIQNAKQVVTANNAVTKSVGDRVLKETLLHKLYAEQNSGVTQKYLTSINGLKLGYDRLNAEGAKIIVNQKGIVSSFNSTENSAFRMGVKLNMASQTFLNMSEQMIATSKKMQFTGRQLIMGLTLPMVAVGTAATKVALDFSKASIELRNQLIDAGFAAEKSTTEIKALNEQASILSVQFGKFSAKDITTVQEEFAKIAQNIGDVQKLTRETLNFDIIGNIGDLASTSHLVGLLYSNLGRDINATKLALAQFEAVSDHTNINLNEIATSFPKLLGTLKHFNIDIGRGAVYLAAFTQSGADAEKGVTALGRLIPMLSSQLARFADTKYKGTDSNMLQFINQFNKANPEKALASFDKNGKLLGGDQLIERLAAFWKDAKLVNDAQKIKFGQDLFGARFTSTDIPFLDTLGEAVTNKTGEVYKALQALNKDSKSLISDYSKEIARILGDPSIKFAGQIQKFTNMARDLGRSLIPMLTNIISKLSDWVSKFDTLSPKLKSFVGTLLLFLGALGPINFILGTLGMSIGQISKAIFKLTTKSIPVPYKLVQEAGVGPALAGIGYNSAAKAEAAGPSLWQRLFGQHQASTDKFDRSVTIFDTSVKKNAWINRDESGSMSLRGFWPGPKQGPPAPERLPKKLEELLVRLEQRTINSRSRSVATVLEPFSPYTDLPTAAKAHPDLAKRAGPGIDMSYFIREIEKDHGITPATMAFLEDAFNSQGKMDEEALKAATLALRKMTDEDLANQPKLAALRRKVVTREGKGRQIDATKLSPALQREILIALPDQARQGRVDWAVEELRKQTGTPEAAEAFSKKQLERKAPHLHDGSHLTEINALKERQSLYVNDMSKYMDEFYTIFNPDYIIDPKQLEDFLAVTERRYPHLKGHSIKTRIDHIVGTVKGMSREHFYDQYGALKNLGVNEFDELITGIENSTLGKGKEKEEVRAGLQRFLGKNTTLKQRFKGLHSALRARGSTGQSQLMTASHVNVLGDFLRQGVGLNMDEIERDAQAEYNQAWAEERERIAKGAKAKPEVKQRRKLRSVGKPIVEDVWDPTDPYNKEIPNIPSVEHRIKEKISKINRAESRKVMFSNLGLGFGGKVRDVTNVDSGFYPEIEQAGLERIAAQGFRTAAPSVHTLSPKMGILNKNAAFFTKSVSAELGKTMAMPEDFWRLVSRKLWGGMTQEQMQRSLVADLSSKENIVNKLKKTAVDSGIGQNVKLRGEEALKKKLEADAKSNNIVDQSAIETYVNEGIAKAKSAKSTRLIDDYVKREIQKMATQANLAVTQGARTVIESYGLAESATTGGSLAQSMIDQGAVSIHEDISKMGGKVSSYVPYQYQQFIKPKGVSKLKKEDELKHIQNNKLKAEAIANGIRDEIVVSDKEIAELEKEATNLQKQIKETNKAKVMPTNIAKEEKTLAAMETEAKSAVKNSRLMIKDARDTFLAEARNKARQSGGKAAEIEQALAQAQIEWNTGIERAQLEAYHENAQRNVKDIVQRRTNLGTERYIPRYDKATGLTSVAARKNKVGFLQGRLYALTPKLETAKATREAAVNRLPAIVAGFDSFDKEEEEFLKLRFSQNATDATILKKAFGHQDAKTGQWINGLRGANPFRAIKGRISSDMAKALEEIVVTQAVDQDDIKRIIMRHTTKTGSSGVSAKVLESFKGKQGSDDILKKIIQDIKLADENTKITLADLQKLTYTGKSTKVAKGAKATLIQRVLDDALLQQIRALTVTKASNLDSKTLDALSIYATRFAMEAKAKTDEFNRIFDFNLTKAVVDRERQQEETQRAASDLPGVHRARILDILRPPKDTAERDAQLAKQMVEDSQRRIAARLSEIDTALKGTIPGVTAEEAAMTEHARVIEAAMVKERKALLRSQTALQSFDRSAVEAEAETAQAGKLGFINRYLTNKAKRKETAAQKKAALEADRVLETAGNETLDLRDKYIGPNYKKLERTEHRRALVLGGGFKNFGQDELDSLIDLQKQEQKRIQELEAAGTATSGPHMFSRRQIRTNIPKMQAAAKAEAELKAEGAALMQFMSLSGQGLDTLDKVNVPRDAIDERVGPKRPGWRQRNLPKLTKALENEVTVDKETGSVKDRGMAKRFFSGIRDTFWQTAVSEPKKALTGIEKAAVKGAVRDTGQALTPLNLIRKPLGMLFNNKMLGGLGAKAGGLVGTLSGGEAAGATGAAVGGGFAALLPIIITVGAAILLIWKNWKSVSKGLGDGLSHLKNAFHGLLNAIMSPFKTMLQNLGLIGGTGTKNAQSLKDAWVNVGKVLNVLFHTLADVMRPVAAVVGLIARAIASMIEIVVRAGLAVAALFSGDFKGFVEQIKKITTIIQNFFADLLAEIVKLILQGAGLILKALLQTFRFAVLALANLLSAIPFGPFKGWGDDLHKFADNFTSTWSSRIDNAVDNTALKVKNMLSTGGDGYSHTGNVFGDIADSKFKSSSFKSHKEAAIKAGLTAEDAKQAADYWWNSYQAALERAKESAGSREKAKEAMPANKKFLKDAGLKPGSAKAKEAMDAFGIGPKINTAQDIANAKRYADQQGNAFVQELKSTVERKDAAAKAKIEVDQAAKEKALAEAADWVHGFRSEMDKVTSGWKDTALKGFDEYATAVKKKLDNEYTWYKAAVDNKIQALDILQQKERDMEEDRQYYEKKDQLRKDRENKSIKYYLDSRRLVYVGDFQGLQALDMQHKQDMTDMDKQDKDAEVARLQQLNTRSIEAQKKDLEQQKKILEQKEQAAKDSLDKRLTMEKDHLDKVLQNIIASTPQSIAAARKMQQAIYGAVAAETHGYENAGRLNAQGWTGSWETAVMANSRTIQDNATWEGLVAQQGFLRGLGVPADVIAAIVPQSVASNAPTPPSPANSRFGSGKDKAGPHHTGGGIGSMSGAPTDIPATLQSGEYVIQRRAVQTVGTNFLEQINRAHEKPKFHEGGSVGPKLHSGGPLDKGAVAFGKSAVQKGTYGFRAGRTNIGILSPDAYRAFLQQKINAMGGLGYDESGYDPKRVIGDMKGATPGIMQVVRIVLSHFTNAIVSSLVRHNNNRSYHNKGQAADFDIPPGGNDPRDAAIFQFLEPLARKGILAELISDHVRPYAYFNGVPYGHPYGGHGDHTHAAVANAFKDGFSNIPTGGAPPTPGNASVKDYVRGQLGVYGWGQDQWPALDQLISHESGWRPEAKNPISTAAGLFQFLDSTWRSYITSRGGPAYWSTDIGWQTKGGLNYIKSRYHTPSEAWAFWQRQSPHWYHSGGLVQLAKGGDIMSDGMAYLHKNEKVLTAPLSRDLEIAISNLANSNMGAGTTREGDIVLDIHNHFEGGFFGTDRELSKLVTHIENAIIPKLSRAKGLENRNVRGYT